MTDVPKVSAGDPIKADHINRLAARANAAEPTSTRYRHRTVRARHRKAFEVVAGVTAKGLEILVYPGAWIGDGTDAQPVKTWRYPELTDEMSNPDFASELTASAGTCHVFLQAALNNENAIVEAPQLKAESTLPEGEEKTVIVEIAEISIDENGAASVTQKIFGNAQYATPTTSNSETAGTHACRKPLEIWIETTDAQEQIVKMKRGWWIGNGVDPTKTIELSASGTIGIDENGDFNFGDVGGGTFYIVATANPSDEETTNKLIPGPGFERATLSVSASNPEADDFNAGTLTVTEEHKRRSFTIGKVSNGVVTNFILGAIFYSTPIRRHPFEVFTYKGQRWLNGGYWYGTPHGPADILKAEPAIFGSEGMPLYIRLINTKESEYITRYALEACMATESNDIAYLIHDGSEQVIQDNIFWRPPTPFTISYNKAANKIRIEGGVWHGNGVSMQNSTSSGSSADRLAADAFSIPPTEFDIVNSENADKGNMMVFAAQASFKLGRIHETPQDDGSYGIPIKVGYYEDGTASIDPNDTPLHGINSGNGAPGTIVIGTFNRQTLQITQTQYGDIYFPPVPGACAPLYFHPIQGTPNSFECLGGLLRVSPNYIDNGADWILHGNKNQQDCYTISQPGNAAQRGIPEPVIIPIPPATITPETPNVSDEWDPIPPAGYVVFLRATFKGFKTADEWNDPDRDDGAGTPLQDDERSLFPDVEIEWDYAAIPHGAERGLKLWNADKESTITPDLDTTTCIHTFLSQTTAGGMKIQLICSAASTENCINNFTIGCYIDTESFEEIIPIGMIFRTSSGEGVFAYENEKTGATETCHGISGRFAYLAIQQGGIVEWTPKFRASFTSGNLYTESCDHIQYYP